MSAHRIALVALALGTLAACEPMPERDAGDGGADALDAGADAPVVLRADAGPNQHVYVGDEVRLDGAASTGDIASYTWVTGDGRRLEASSDPVAVVSYPEPGRFSAVLTVIDAEGTRRTDVAVITATRRPVFTPASSSSITAMLDGTVAVAVHDADHVALFDGELTGQRLVPTCDGPRQIAALPGRLVVTCPGDDRVSLIDPVAGAEVSALTLAHGDAPFGVVALDADHVAIGLQNAGEVIVVEIAPTALTIVERWTAIADARAMTMLPDGRLVISRWRSPDTGGELCVLDPRTGARSVVTLAVDPQAASDTEIGGVPSYLESLAVSPDGQLLLVASLQAAIGEGTFRAGRALRFETMVRATVSFVDVPSEPGGALEEDFGRRRQLDNRGFASAVTFSERGDFAFVATRGNRTIERYDVLGETTSGSIQDLGFAIEGIGVRGGTLYADLSLSRTVRSIAIDGDVDAFVPLAESSTVESEPLDAPILSGARLFNDSADPRLSQDGYVACAHCHLEGLDDHRVWDFTDRGEGLRNTIELGGRDGEGHGPIHWSANFDEIEDFENDIRGPFSGAGLMSDADFDAHADTLGAPKRGLSEDLDALAAYVRTLRRPRSPHRDDDGSLSEAALRGEAIFQRPALGCTTCHAGDVMTDSAFVTPGVPLLHDVGTLGPGSGMRRGGALDGIDTPTLRGLWSSAPYLHDGSAATLREVLVDRNPDDAHGVTSGLTDDELDDLTAYLLSLE